MKKTYVKYLLRSLAIFGVTLALLVAGVYAAMWILVKGPSPEAGRLFVLSVRETSAAKFLADWFMSPEEIAALYNTNQTDEKDVTIDTGLVSLPTDDTSDGTGESGGDGDSGSTNGPSEPADKMDGIEIVDVKGPTYNGKMMIVSDPRRVIVGVADSYGVDSSGLTLTEMYDKYGAVAATNAGGFYDLNGQGTGGIPDGMVIYEGKKLWGEDGVYYSMMGIDSSGLLHVGSMTPERALELGVQYSTCYGPALIINGVPCNAQYPLQGGLNPRTAIGQRSDGAILLLVINGRQVNSLGATLDDLVEVMVAHGAVNAMNLDGGSSSLMYCQGEFVTQSAYIYGLRKLPTAIIVK